MANGDQPTEIGEVADSKGARIVGSSSLSSRGLIAGPAFDLHDHSGPD